MDNENRIPQDPIGSELVQEDASFADIVAQFVEGLSNRLTRIEEAINTADFESLRTAAHQLKGSGGGYGYPTVSEAAAKIEREAKARALDECVESFEQLKQLCERVVVSPDE